MKGNVLKQYLETQQPESRERPADESPEPEDLGMFGLLRGRHDRAVALEVRHKDGSIDALPYAYLYFSSFDKSDGIKLQFGGKIVRITGRNLNAEVRQNVRLFSAIVRHKVPWIEEASGSALLQVAKGVTVIEHIEVE